MVTQADIKHLDVYRFNWLLDLYAKARPGEDLNWAFDGQLLAVETPIGIVLADTYWGWPVDGRIWNDIRTMTPAEALSKGTLELVCNLSDLEPAQACEANNLAPADFFDLSRQHGCYKQYFKRRGAARDQARMREVLTEQIEKTERHLRWQAEDLERMREHLTAVEAGDLSMAVWTRGE